MPAEGMRASSLARLDEVSNVGRMLVAMAGG